MLLEEIYPGEILLEDFIKPMGISARGLAAALSVPVSRVHEIIHGKRPITTDTALRLGLLFQMEPDFWLNLQTEYDLRIAKRDLMPKLKEMIRPISVDNITSASFA
ncbi:MAG: HigA family addiction module antitoxin [Thiomicrospira sp.]